MQTIPVSAGMHKVASSGIQVKMAYWSDRFSYCNLITGTVLVVLVL